MKHTPGPWKVGRQFKEDRGRVVVPIEYVAPTCGSCGVSPGRYVVAWLFKNALPKQQLIPNANLFAAAPELLEALKGLLDASGLDCEHDETHRGGVAWTFCDQCGVSWEDDKKPVRCDAAVKAIAAIAKAEGAE